MRLVDAVAPFGENGVAGQHQVGRADQVVAALEPLQHARADGYDIDRPLWASVAHKDFAKLERGEKTGDLSAIRIYENRADAAAEGRDVAPVYLKTLQKPVFDLVGEGREAGDNRRGVVQALWASADFRDWMVSKGVESPEAFEAMISKGDWARIPGQGAALMARVADAARRLEGRQSVDGPIRMNGPTGRPVYFVAELSDAVVARDALYRARVSGRSHNDTVGNPALTAAQRAARLARQGHGGMLDGRGARLLSHDGETILSALERADDVRTVSGNDVVFFRGPTKDGTDSFQVFDHDARRVAGAGISGLSVQEIEIGGDWTAQADIADAEEMHRIAEALAAKGTAVSVAYLGSSGLEVVRYGTDGSQERIPVTKELLETMKKAAEAEAKVRPGASADSPQSREWAGKTLHERLTSLGTPMRNEILAVRDGSDFVLSGVTAWRAAGIGAVPEGLEADPSHLKEPVRLNAAAFAELGRLLADRNMRLMVANGADRVSWSAWDKLHMETGRNDGPPPAAGNRTDDRAQHAENARGDAPPPPESADPPPSVGLEELREQQDGIPFVITREMRAELADRGYTESQVRAMRPAEAQEILQTDPDRLQAHMRRPDGPGRSVGPGQPDGQGRSDEPRREGTPQSPVTPAERTGHTGRNAVPKVSRATRPSAARSRRPKRGSKNVPRHSRSRRRPKGLFTSSGASLSVRTTR